MNCKAIIITLALTLGLSLLVPGSVHAERSAKRWTNEELLLEVGWEFLHLLDWRQTRSIAKHPERWNECGTTSWFLGSHPDPSSVDRLFLLSAVAHPLVTELLPREARAFGATWHPRRAWQYFTIVAKGRYVVLNFTLDIPID